MSDVLIVGILGALATVLAAWLGVHLRRRSPSAEATNPAALGIRVTRPTSGERLSPGRVEVTGTFLKPPREGFVFLLTAPVDKGAYWPQVGQPIEFSHSRKSWSGSAWVQGEGRILVVLVGNGGRALFRYYEKVGLARNDYLPIEELPPDVLELDSVYVRISPEV